MKKLLAVLFVVSVLISCSKDDEKTQDGAIVKLEVQNSLQGNFNEIVAIELTSLSSDTESLKVYGADWDETMNYPFAKIFLRNGLMSNSYEYKTSDKVSSFTYTVKINDNEQSTEPLITTLKFYVDDQLIKTKTITTDGESETTEVIDVTAY